jgi:hypothetical protein
MASGTPRARPHVDRKFAAIEVIETKEIQAAEALLL